MEKGRVKEAPLLPSQKVAKAVVKNDYSAQEIANAFVEQYFDILQECTKNAHKFYKDQSTVARPAADGSMKSITTMKDIDDEMMTSKIKDWYPKVTSVHAQDSIMESVVVAVTGSLIDNDNVKKYFTQTFFLAPQEGNGFFVRNDIFQIIDIPKPSDDVVDDDAEGDAGSLIDPLPNAEKSSPKAAQVPNKDQKEKSGTSTEEAEDTGNKDQKEKSSTSTKEAEDTGNKVAKSSVSAKPYKKNVSSVAQPAPKKQEDITKVSYASILAKESSLAPPPQASASAPKSSALPVKARTPPNNGGAFSHGTPENIYDVKSIHIKDLPPKLTPDSLLEKVKKFGPVKHKNIQIREYPEDGYRYAFVEFDNPKAARRAIEAGFIEFEDRESEIQYKRSYNQGGNNNMKGRGGYRNDNFRARDGNGRGNWNRFNEHEHRGNYSGRNANFQDQARGPTYVRGG